MQELSLFVSRLTATSVSLQQQAKDDPNFGQSRLQKIVKPLNFEELGRMVWQEPLKGSVRNQRPWFRIFGREKPETLRPLFQQVIDPEVIYPKF